MYVLSRDDPFHVLGAAERRLQKDCNLRQARAQVGGRGGVGGQGYFGVVDPLRFGALSRRRPQGQTETGAGAQRRLSGFAVAQYAVCAAWLRGGSQGFSQAHRQFHPYLVGVSGNGVGGVHDKGELGIHQFLNQHGHVDRPMCDAALSPADNGPTAPQ